MILFLPSIILAFLSILWIKFPPKKINSIYGYRTPKSMKTEFKWNFANYFSSRYLLFFSLSFMIFALVCLLFIDGNFETILLVFVTSFILGLILIIPITELFLNIINNIKNENNS